MNERHKALRQRASPAGLRQKSIEYEIEAAEARDPVIWAQLCEISAVFKAMAERAEYRGKLH